MINIYKPLKCDKRWMGVIFLCISTALCAISPAPAKAISSQELFDYWAELYPQVLRPETPAFDASLLAKASPNECFYGMGDPANQYMAQTCTDGTWKVNEGLVWGMTKSGNKLWLGTLNNPRCLTGGDPILGTTPFLFEDYVCEFGEGSLSPPFPAAYGDWRPPSTYVYNLETKKLTQKDVLNPLTMQGLPLIHGIRGAGALNGIVFFGGGSGIPIAPFESITLLAYNSDSEVLLGWHNLEDSSGDNYFNVRKWLTYKNNLYVCVWKDGGGHVLRWLGDAQAIKNGDLSTLWSFEEVGHLDSQPANIAVYEGNRIAVATRPIGIDDAARMGGGSIWLSPSFDDHLTSADTNNWQKIWQVADYDPDEITTMVTGVGDLRYFKGYLWWGTQHIPGVSWRHHLDHYSIILDNYPTEEDEVSAYYGTWRPTIVFRGRHFGTAQEEIEILYGFTHLPKFVVNDQTGQGEWTIAPNNMSGSPPLFGKGGFGNWYQFYTFTVEVFKNQLFIGTNLISMRFAKEGAPFPMPVAPHESLWGAELWRFPNSQSPAVAETLSGFGNYTNVSVRNMVVSNDALYVGTGNPHNLLTDPDDDIPEGGWEVWELKNRSRGMPWLQLLLLEGLGGP